MNRSAVEIRKRGAGSVQSTSGLVCSRHGVGGIGFGGCSCWLSEVGCSDDEKKCLNSNHFVFYIDKTPFSCFSRSQAFVIIWYFNSVL